MNFYNSDIIIAIFAITVVILLLGSFGIIFTIIHKKKQQSNTKEKLLLQSKFQQTLLESQLEIQEQTLKNISQEIHDNIGQVLSLVKLNINTMDYNEPKALQDKINDSKHLITKAIQDLRDLSKSLHTDYVTELGLLRSIEYELEMIKKTGSYEIKFDIEGKTYRLEAQQELILFRIVQEALHNITKHAKATAIAVNLMFEPEEFILRITDNGVGFDASQLNSNNYNGVGLGIRNMYNRANMMNTTFKLTSTLEKGTIITLTLPLQTSKS